MDKKITAVAIIFIVLLVLAMRTAKMPPATINEKESSEIFYKENRTVTIVEKDGWGLFTLKVEKIVSDFNFEIEFPEGTNYLIKVNGKDYKGTSKFETKLSEDAEIIVQFQLPQEVVEKIYREKSTEYYIKIKMNKLPFWRSEYEIFLIPKEGE